MHLCLAFQVLWEPAAPRLDERLRRTALLFVEVDRLKYLGDDLGQSGSAALLAEVARRLRAAAGVNGLIGRFSSDEFTIAIDCTSAAHLDDLVTRVQVAFSTPVSTRDLELFLVATVGAAVLKVVSVVLSSSPCMP